MCPNHVDHELVAVGSSVTTSSTLEAAGVKPLHKFRMKRNPKIVDHTGIRGLPNNGLIQIVETKARVSDGNNSHSMYRVDEDTIKLDFLERGKR